MKTSVIICTYNYARFLPQCLESVFNQTYLPDEVVVVDDGSTDETPEVVRRFDGAHYIRQEHSGKTAAFNQGFEASEGEIICHLDADDYWLPEKLASILQAFDSFPSAGGLIHEVFYVDADGKSLYSSSPPDHSPALCSLKETLLRSFVYLPSRYKRGFGVANTICVKRESVQDLFPLDPRLGLSVDGLLLLAVARRGLLCWPEVLSAYRHHGANQFVNNPSSLLYQLQLFRWLLDHPCFGRVISIEEQRLMRAKLMEETLLACRQSQVSRWRGLQAGIQLWWQLGRQKIMVGWKHLVIPFLCLIRRSGHAG